MISRFEERDAAVAGFVIALHGGRRQLHDRIDIRRFGHPGVQDERPCCERDKRARSDEPAGYGIQSLVRCADVRERRWGDIVSGLTLCGGNVIRCQARERFPIICGDDLKIAQRRTEHGIQVGVNDIVL